MQVRRRSRAFLAATGAALAAAAFACLPLYGYSTVSSVRSSHVLEDRVRIELTNQRRLPLSNVDDPFAHVLPEEHPAVMPRPSLVRREATPIRLRAIVAGKERLALIDDGSSRIVSAGDSVNGVRIQEIGLDKIRLSDGRVLEIEGTPR